MPPHKKSIRLNIELDCIEFDLTQGQVGLISHESKWVLEKYNFYAAWNKTKKDYYILYKDNEDGKIQRLHRLLTDFPPYPEFQVDHINGNPKDNRLSNLTVGSASDNQRNQLIKNKYGVRNIRYIKRDNAYEAEIIDNEGGKKTLTRSCKKWGKEKALQLCKDWRLQKEKEYKGYNKNVNKM